MKNGEATAVQSEAEWNEDEKRIRCMAADESGKCYVLMMSVSEDSIDCKTAEIMVVETDGKVGIYAYTDGTEAEERVAKGDMDFNAEAKVLGFLADGSQYEKENENMEKSCMCFVSVRKYGDTVRV